MPPSTRGAMKRMNDKASWKRIGACEGEAEDVEENNRQGGAASSQRQGKAALLAVGAAHQVGAGGAVKEKGKACGLRGEEQLHEHLVGDAAREGGGGGGGGGEAEGVALFGDGRRHGGGRQGAGEQARKRDGRVEVKERSGRHSGEDLR